MDKIDSNKLESLLYIFQDELKKDDDKETINSIIELLNSEGFKKKVSKK